MGFEVYVGPNDDACVGPRLETVEAKAWLVSSVGQGAQGGGPEGLGEASGKRPCTSPTRLLAVYSQLYGKTTQTVSSSRLLRDEC